MNRTMVLISLSEIGIETIKSNSALPEAEMEFINKWREQGVLESFYISISKKRCCNNL
ncbi:MAG: hypothetical protein IT267_09885 [Saprospiraceae bacterium]|nr:hypothetical protein [Saprospiraceae bacterium]